MTDIRALNLAAAAAIAAIPASQQPEVLVGFDGFIDHIIAVVAKRNSPSDYTAIPTIADFGAKISAAAGKSANVELVVKQSKIGGNGPIMANALCSQDAKVIAVGLLGVPALDPVFAPLANRATKTISIGNPGVTDALEFHDGKVMLGKITSLDGITFERLIEALGGVEAYQALLKTPAAIATVNWTMTMGMTELWLRTAREILPSLRADRPLWFIDLADPAKRQPEDIRAALDALTELQTHVDVVLGLNEAECRQILGVLGSAWPTAEHEWEAARAGCDLIRMRLGLSVVMCHLVKSSACAWGTVRGLTAGSVGNNGFFEPKPMITTGAGDHFNAGFLSALLAGLAPAHALQAGGATSGHYVRTAVSPNRAQLITFLKSAAK